ncbi:hypothetical protein ElyMa_002826300, partial [Elysia marginata]
PSFAAVVLIFSAHGCITVPSTCSGNIGVSGQPSCSEVKTSGQCMFDKCPAIQGTEDEKKAADILVQSAKDDFGCDLNSNELTGNGSFGVLQRPIWESLAVLLTAALLRKFVV